MFKYFFFCMIFLVGAMLNYDLLNGESNFLLITGCGRSGTSYMTKFLKKSGVRVEHEKPGEDGCVSWPMSVNYYSPWGPNAGNIEFIHVFHQVRNPLHVITSFYTNLPSLDRDEWEFIRKHVPEISREDSLLLHCAKYWYYWNLKAEKISHMRYQIENLEQTLPEIAKLTGLKLDPELLKKLAINENSWLPTPDKITWKELKSELPNELFENIQSMSERYGYPCF